jgi:uroporphyrin-III C-methyltransferase
MSQNAANKLSPFPGRVRLIGAGPGAADLITVRGQIALREADAVFFDDLVNADLLELCQTACERIYVGKRAGCHSAAQAEICEQMVARAREGGQIVRLKGGDPMLFGRAAEELHALAEAGIAVEIIPGVTAAVAAGAVAEIPLTQRGLASAVVFATGHACTGRQATPVNWRAMAALNATICIYMGTQHFAEIADELMAGGLSPHTPVAVIAGATLPTQTVEVGTVADAARLTADPARRPALIVVGEVVRWREIAALAPLGLEAVG